MFTTFSRRWFEEKKKEKDLHDVCDIIIFFPLKLHLSYLLGPHGNHVQIRLMEFDWQVLSFDHYMVA